MNDIVALLAGLDWVAVGEIIMIDLLLGGDNAVVIALACRNLAPAQRRLGILWGTIGAIGLRVVLIFFALSLLKLPFLKLAGAVMLLYIAFKLLHHDDGDEHGDIQGSDRLWGAVKTVIIADFVMSLDNVIAIAGAAEGAAPEQQLPLVIFGLLVSIPIIVWGSQLVIRLMDRFPAVILGGAMLLGWIAGTLVVTDPALSSWIPTVAPAVAEATTEVLPAVRYGAGAAGAALVWVVGWLMRRRAAAQGADATV